MADLPQEVPVIAKREQVQVIYTVNGEFTDALYFPVDAVPPVEEQEAEMSRRHENWKAVINTPRPEPTEEEKAAQIAAMQEQFGFLKQQILNALPTDEAKLAFVQEREAITKAEVLTLEEAIAAKAVIIDGGVLDNRLIIKG